MGNRILVSLLTVWACTATFLWFGGFGRGKHDATNVVTSKPKSASTPVTVPAVEAPAGTGKFEEMERELARLRAEVTRLQKLESSIVASKTSVPSIALAPGSQTPIQGAITNVSDSIAKALAEALKPGNLQNLARMAGGRALNTKDMYAPLFSRLGLTEEQKSRMIALLDQRAGNLESSIWQHLGKLPEDAALKELLGEERYKEWQAYEATVPSRQSVADFESRLQGQGLSLDDAKREELAQLFSRHGLTPADSIEIDGQAGSPMDQQASQAVDKGLEKWDALVQEADGLLDDRQMKELDAYLGERLERRERMAEMAGSLAKGIIIEGLAPGAASNVSTKIHVINSGLDIRSGGKYTLDSPD